MSESRSSIGIYTRAVLINALRIIGVVQYRPSRIRHDPQGRVSISSPVYSHSRASQVAFESFWIRFRHGSEELCLASPRAQDKIALYSSSLFVFTSSWINTASRNQKLVHNARPKGYFNKKNRVPAVRVESSVRAVSLNSSRGAMMTRWRVATSWWRRWLICCDRVLL